MHYTHCTKPRDKCSSAQRLKWPESGPGHGETKTRPEGWIVRKGKTGRSIGGSRKLAVYHKDPHLMMNTIKKYFNLEFNVKNVKAQFSMVQH